ncbi:alpha/beta hydrolase [Breoghania sp. L-A4]|uniref:alpha/beta hydrolase n=1 Tax=Breoghania sp. L-A4 TaxID=2304600 RepID=UPI000E35F631|nr:alpha/beta hydrolase [Breoghania sp. L-A4]AXS39187.1 alpha/beta hydrolase [Breoghania sp. L-A4]
MSERDPQFITVGAGNAAREIAVRHDAAADPAKTPGVLWLSGFKSDMVGSKAVAIAEWVRASGHAMTRFDYSGHGESGGAFEEGTISRWLEETIAVFETVCDGPTVAVGSSMGGWLALLLARALKSRGNGNLAGLILIAPAADFTEELMWKGFPEEVRNELMRTGRYERPSEYDEPYVITRGLIEDGRNNLLMGGSIEPGCPVHILQGMQDADVPWTHAMELVARLPSDDVSVTLVKDGDHRLSRPQDIDLRLIPALVEFGIGVMRPDGA